MSKMIVLAAIAFMSITAKAELFTCLFNEPFITVTLDSRSGEIIWNDLAVGTEQKTYASWLIDNSENVAATFKVEKAEFTIAIDITQKGSDSMSEFVYPTKVNLVNYYGKNRDFSSGCISPKRKTCPKGASCG